MTNLNYQAPVILPKGVTVKDQNSRGYDHGFPPSLSLTEALSYLKEEIDGLEPDRAVLHSNINHIDNPRLTEKLKRDSTIFVELRWGSESYHLICDAWYQPEHNIYAIHLILRSIRQMKKWGVASRAKLMHGFHTQEKVIVSLQALAGTARDDTFPEWMQNLGLGPTATLEDANAVYRQRAKTCGADQDALMMLNQSIEEARRQLR